MDIPEEKLETAGLDSGLGSETPGTFVSKNSWSLIGRKIDETVISRSIGKPVSSNQVPKFKNVDGFEYGERWTGSSVPFKSTLTPPNQRIHTRVISHIQSHNLNNLADDPKSLVRAIMDVAICTFSQALLPHNVSDTIVRWHRLTNFILQKSSSSRCFSRKCIIRI